MEVMEEPDGTGRQVILPVCHIYYPDTFHSVLKSFFWSDGNGGEGDGGKCFLLGRSEVRPGRAGKIEEDGEGMKRKTPGVATRSLRRRRRKKSGGAVGGSRGGVGGGDESISGGAATPSSHGEERNRALETEFRRVLAVNIVGVVGGHEGHLLPPPPAGSDLQIVGEVRSGNLKMEGEGGSSSALSWGSGDSLEPYLHFRFTGSGAGASSSRREDQEDLNLSITALTWNGQLHAIDPRNRLLVFMYDPAEFQQWKIPQGYPLGVPPVFLDGLTFIQNQLQLGQELTFTPTFPPLLQDHQNLNACAEPPSSSYLYTNPVLNFISQRSSGLQQIFHKVSILTGTFLGHYPLLPVLNFLIILGLDAWLGYFITSYLIQIPNMLGLLHTTVDDMLDRLNHLLRWLRGAPAGLKLNVNLNSLYWRFFSYHIHLWANYIGILEPIFAIILHTIQYYGVLGSTIQISLLKDLLSLATFHVYCLYIYATRLYNLQTSTIKALFRMFFGRKYNPLRERIDNVQLATPELFLSSFGFVILIFLLPTTMVYYAGFVCLRVPVLLVERTLQYFVTAFNKLPIVSWVLVYLRSPRVADEVYLAPIIPSSSSTSVISASRSNFVTFRLSLRSTRTLFTPPDLGKGIKNIVGAVMEGTVLKD